MDALFFYSFKLSVCLGVIYGFYYLALRNLTFYNWNRWFLLIGSALSFFIPLVNIHPFLESPEASNLSLKKVVLTLDGFARPVLYAGNSHDAFVETLLPFILIVIGTGMLFQGGKFLCQFISFCCLLRTAHLVKQGPVKIYQVNKNIAPFSFGNSIFINKNLHQPAELQVILKHELVHISQKHTIDVLWIEFLCLVNWYNPFVLLLRRAVRENLEFMVDQKVITSPDLDKKYYQYLILKVIRLPGFPIANQFNISSLKTRILMMNKTPSSRPELIKFLFVIPLMAGLLLACQDNADATFKELTDVPPPPPPAPAAPEVPPPPPPVVITADKLPADQKVFLKNNPQINFIGWHQDDFMLIKLKSGQEENYDLKSKASIAIAEKKYGKLPQIPPPPPITK